MNNQEYDREVHKLLYHLTEVNKIHAKLIDGNKSKAEHNDNRLHAVEKELALLAANVKHGFNVVAPNAENVIMQPKKRSNKEIAQDTGLAATIIAVIIGVVKGIYELFKGS